MRYSWFNYRLNWRDVFNLACGKLGKQRASKGQLALDENLALIVGEVVKTMFWENEE